MLITIIRVVASVANEEVMSLFFLRVASQSNSSMIFEMPISCVLSVLRTERWWNISCPVELYIRKSSASEDSLLAELIGPFKNILNIFSRFENIRSDRSQQKSLVLNQCFYLHTYVRTHTILNTVSYQALYNSITY